MTRAEWVEKEVAEQEAKMPLDARNKSTWRSMKEKEFEFGKRKRCGWTITIRTTTIK